MRAKKYLGEIYYLRRRCEILGEQVAQLRTQVEGVKGIVYDKDKVQTSTVNAVEDQLARLADLERRYEKSIERYHKAILHREDQIAHMPRPEHAELLRMRYLEVDSKGRRYTLEEIAVKTHWSYDRVRHMHGEALAAFGRKYLGQ